MDVQGISILNLAQIIELGFISIFLKQLFSNDEICIHMRCRRRLFRFSITDMIKKRIKIYIKCGNESNKRKTRKNYCKKNACRKY